MKDLQRTYLELLHVARCLIASPEVEARWDQPSALPEYRMDALAGHLLHTATVTVIAGLETSAPTGIEPLDGRIYHRLDPAGVAVCRSDPHVHRWPDTGWPEAVTGAARRAS